MTNRPHTCTHPGCNQVLCPDNTTNMCRRHIHSKGLCMCRRCGNRPEKEPRDDLKVHHIPATGESRQRSIIFATVTLSKPPWEDA